jgi:hypothetical protein
MEMVWNTFMYCIKNHATSLLRVLKYVTPIILLQANQRKGRVIQKRGFSHVPRLAQHSNARGHFTRRIYCSHTLAVWTLLILFSEMLNFFSEIRFFEN